MFNLFQMFNFKFGVINFLIMSMILIIYLMKNFYSNIFMMSMKIILKKEMMTMFSNKKHMMMMSKYLLNLFFIILFFNIISMMSYNFSFTSHIYLPVFLSFHLFLSIIIYIIMYNMKNFFLHLTPQGSPMYLMQILVFIELISFFIRPLTLFLRLVINMMAGHILLSMVSNLMLEYSYLIIIFIFFFIMEIMVAFIQSYVFFTLLSLYMKENL